VSPDVVAKDRPTCGYCGTVFDSKSVTTASLDSRQAPHASGRGRRLVALLLAVAAAGIGGFVVLRARAVAPPGMAEPSATQSATPVPETQRIPVGPPGVMWIDQYAHVVAADVNGDEIEDIFGGFAEKEGENVNAYIGAFDGKDLHMIWRDGPFSTRAKGTRKTKVAYAAGRLVATTARGEALLYDATNGKRLATFPFDAEIRDPCGPPPGGKTVWIKMDGDNGFAIDVTSAVGKPSAAPAWCTDRRHRTTDSSDCWTRQAHTITGGFLIPDPAASDLPKIPHFDLAIALSDGGDAVAIGELRGEEGAVFVGFNPETKAVRWQTGVKALTTDGVTSTKRTNILIDIAFGRFYFNYERGGASFLAALDAKTGAKVLDTQLLKDGMPDNPTFTPSRIYLVQWKGDGTPVHVLDARSGALLGAFGGLAGDVNR
jgi:hypothetical protein